MKGIEEKQIEAPYELPEGWKWCRLGDVADCLDGFRKPINATERAGRTGNVPYYGATGQVGWIDDFLTNEELVLLGEDGAPFLDLIKEKAYLISGKAWVNNHAHILRSKYGEIGNRYLLNYLNIFNYSGYVNGTTRLKLTQGEMLKIPFPLPPTLAEQQRIVNRIESMFAKLDEAKEKAQNVVDGFETRKAAILHKAFTGELTANWRKENGIEKNKELDFIYNFAQTLSKKDMTNITDFQKQAYDYVLSDGAVWKKCCIGAIGVITNGSTPSRKEASFWNGNIPWVSSGEVANNTIESTNEMISEEGFNNSSVKKLPIGTVLIAMIGEGKTRGQTSVLNIEATTNQNIAAIIINHGHVESKFLWYWLQKEYKNNRTAGNGSGPQALNCQKVRELPFILPTLPEQVEIVRILEIIIEKENKAKQAAEAVLEQIDLLKKSILARAFRGEL